MADPGLPAGRIPVTLVTGFLGAGKTTLINVALKAPGMAGTVVVVNEFGEVGLDHQLYANSSDNVVLLENGCLCCTVKSDLVATLNGLFHDRASGRIPHFDRVVVETSGLAEPGPVVQAFLSEPTLDGLFRVASVLALVDAVNWASTVENHDEASRQVALADRILVTKLDLLGGDRPAREDALVAELKAMNPAATVTSGTLAESEIAALLSSPGFDAADPAADPRPWLGPIPEADLSDPHLKRRGIENFMLFRDRPVSRQELQFLLDGIGQNLGASLLRVKGLVNVQEEPGRPAVIQGVQHLLHTMTWLDRWPDEDERTRLVFITQGIGREQLSEIVELLDRVSRRTFRAREAGRAAQLAAGYGEAN